MQKWGVSMDHSLRGYLKQRTTEELDAILNYIVNNYTRTPEETMGTIISILEEREKDRKDTPEFQALLARCLEIEKRKAAERRVDDSVLP